MRVKKWETKILMMTFRPKMKAGGRWVDCRRRTSTGAKGKVEEDETTDDGRQERGEGVQENDSGNPRWRTTTTWWRCSSAWSTRMDAASVSRWKYNSCVVWETPVAKWEGEGEFRYRMRQAIK